jgi:hypothetical protein
VDVLTYSDLSGPRFRSGGLFFLVMSGFASVAALVILPTSLFLAGFIGATAFVHVVVFLLHFGLMRRVRLDRGRGTVSVWRGVLLPMWGGERALAEFSAVCAEKVRRWGAMNTDEDSFFAVDLLGYGDRKLRIGCYRTWPEARDRAAAVARFLSIEFTELTAPAAC